MPPLTKNYSQAFSLVEMLIGIACISVLAALLLPVASRMAEQNKTIKCASNLRQIGVAAQLWSTDNANRILPVYNPNPGTSIYSPNKWPALLFPYLGRTDSDTVASPREMPIFVCPVTPKRWGYGHNYNYLSWILNVGNIEQWVTYAQIPKPAQTVFLVDSFNPTDANSWNAYVRPPSLKGLNDQLPSFRHPGKLANVLWLDGHVSKVSQDVLMKDDELWDRQ